MPYCHVSWSVWETNKYFGQKQKRRPKSESIFLHSTMTARWLTGFCFHIILHGHITCCNTTLNLSSVRPQSVSQQGIMFLIKCWPVQFSREANVFVWVMDSSLLYYIFWKFLTTNLTHSTEAPALLSAAWYLSLSLLMGWTQTPDATCEYHTFQRFWELNSVLSFLIKIRRHRSMKN